MSCICCKNTAFLGCYTPCETLTLPILSPSTQTYTLSLNFAGNVVELESVVGGGANLAFDISKLNEFYLFEGVLKVGGVDLVLVDGNGIEYDCVSFKTDLGVNNNFVSSINLTIL